MSNCMHGEPLHGSCSQCYALADGGSKGPMDAVKRAVDSGVQARIDKMNGQLDSLIASEKDKRIAALERELAEARAENARLAALVPKWSPIESAPKDGTWILVVNDERPAWIVKWDSPYPSGYVPENPWFNMMLNLRPHPNQFASTVPTRWMPLPQPPTGDSQP